MENNLKIYQAGYFRLGKQSVDSGWQIVSPSQEMDNEARTEFESISSVILDDTSTLQLYKMGFFAKRRYSYIMHINPRANAEDVRNVQFVHGYVFSIDDMDELCKDPSRIFGIKDECFYNEYRGSEYENGTPYPVVTELPYDEFNELELINKYGFDKESRYNLMCNVIAALDEMDDALCINISSDVFYNQADYIQTYKEIMYLIMKWLPRRMRLKMSAFSCNARGTRIYINKQISSKNYFDINTKEHSECYESIRKNRLLRTLYSCFDVVTESDLNNFSTILINPIAKMEDILFKNPLRDIKWQQCECALGWVLIRNTDSSSNKAGIIDIISVLKYMSSQKMTDSPEVDKYITRLLEYFNNSGKYLKNNEINDFIKKRIEAQDDSNQDIKAELKLQLEVMKLSKLLENDESKFYEYLWNLHSKDQLLYDKVIDHIKNDKEIIYKKYIYGYYIPKDISSVADANRKYLKYSEKIADDELRQCIVNTILKRIDEIFKLSPDETTVSSLIMDSLRAADYLENYLSDAERIVKSLLNNFWEKYNVENFKTKFIDFYNEFATDKFMKYTDDSIKEDMIPDVKQVMYFLSKDDITEESKTYLKKIIFSRDVINSAETKNKILEYKRDNILKRIKESSYAVSIDFDYLLMLFYDASDNVFNISEWIRKLSKITSCQKFFFKSDIPRYIQRSKIIKEKNELVKKSFEIALGKNVNDDNKKTLKTYYKLLGKKQSSTYSASYNYAGEIDSTGFLVNTIQRIPLLVLALIALLSGVRIVYENLGMNNILMLTDLIAAGVSIAGSFIAWLTVKIIGGSDITIFEQMGVVVEDEFSFLRFILLLTLFLGFAIIGVVLFLKANLLLEMIYTLVISITAVVMLCAYFIFFAED